MSGLRRGRSVGGADGGGRRLGRVTLPQALIVVLLVAVIVRAVLSNSVLTSRDLGSVYWAALGVILLCSFLSEELVRHPQVGAAVSEPARL